MTAEILQTTEDVLLNPFRYDRLTPQHLALLFPAAFYQNDESLALHLTESCLVEQTTWEGDNAVGETAFWLKVLSTPQTEFLKEQKRLFKVQIAEKCKTLPILNNGIDPAPATPLAPTVLDTQAEPLNTVQEPQTTSSAKKRKINPATKPRTLIKHNPNQVTLIPKEVENETDGNTEVESSEQTTEISNVVPHDVMESTDSMFGINTYKCKTCSFSTDTRDKLNRHHKMNHPAERPYACEYCNYTSRYPWNIKSHIENVHLKTKRFKCDQCDFTSPQACLLRRHQSRVHCTSKDIKCDYCDYRTNHKDVLKRHVHMKHTGDFDHKCPHCPFGRDAKYEVEDHINAVHLKKVIYQCSECSFHTYRRLTLRAHHRDHETKTIMLCKYCEYKSLYAGSLAKHIKDDHPDQELPPELKEAKLKQDQKNITTDDVDYTPVLMAKCKLCDFTCERIAKLKSHVRRHHNRSKYQCHMCRTTFANNRNMKTHYMKKHPGVSIPDADSDKTVSVSTADAVESATVVPGEEGGVMVIPVSIEGSEVNDADQAMLAEVEASGAVETDDGNTVILIENVIETETNLADV